MRKDAERPTTRKEKIIETKQENKRVIKEENKILNQLEINQKKNSIKKNKQIFKDKSLKIEKNNSIFNDEIKKKNKRVKKNLINFLKSYKFSY